MLSVNGVFATNKVALFIKELLIGVGIVALGVMGVWHYRRWRKSHPRRKNESQVTPRPDTAANEHSTAPLTTSTTPSNITPMTEQRKWKIIGLVSSISIIGTLALTFLGAVTFANLSDGTSGGAIELFGALTLMIGWFFLPFIFILRYGLRLTFTWALLQTVSVYLIMILLIGLPAFISDISSGSRPYLDTYDYRQ